MQRKDDVRLSAALKRLSEEDPGLTIVHDSETGEIVVHGLGEMHLRVTMERLEGKYQIAVERREPAIGYRETIRKGISLRGRHKKQSGGHGQFGDVVIDIKPMARGTRFLNSTCGSKRNCEPASACRAASLSGELAALNSSAAHTGPITKFALMAAKTC